MRTTNTAVQNMHDRAEDAPFTPESSFFHAVANAGDARNFADIDPRLRALSVVQAAAGMSTLNGPDGGFTLPKPEQVDLITGIMDSPVVANADVRTSDSVEVDVLSLDRSTGRNGGLEVQHVGEGEQLPAVFPTFAMAHMEKHPYYAFIPATNKVLRNSPTLARDIRIAAATAYRFIIADLIVNGLGAAPQFLGIRHTSNLIVQALESTQSLANSADFLAFNAAKMLKSVTPIADAAFYMHQDNYADLMLSTIGDVQGGAVTPPDAGAPFGRLWNRPMYPIDVAPAPGTVGDFMLCSMSDYLVVLQGMQEAISTHVKFVTNESVFRFTQFMNAQPKTARRSLRPTARRCSHHTSHLPPGRNSTLNATHKKKRAPVRGRGRAETTHMLSVELTSDAVDMPPLDRFLSAADEVREPAQRLRHVLDHLPDITAVQLPAEPTPEHRSVYHLPDPIDAAIMILPATASGRAVVVTLEARGVAGLFLGLRDYELGELHGGRAMRAVLIPVRALPDLADALGEVMTRAASMLHGTEVAV